MVAVLLYHGLVGWAGGGFLGVDVFFVLSGYLITSLLLDEWHRWGSIDLVGFYLRRARRLLPALVLVVGAVAIWASFEAKPDRLGGIRADGLSSLLYVTNWRFILVKVSYFEQYGDPSPFRHMWSLAIEEQFYLVFPLLLIGLLGLARRRIWLLPAALACMTVASILAMRVLYDPTTDPSRVYYGSDTRAHELLIGSLLAVGLAGLGRFRPLAARLAPYVGVLGLVSVLACLHFFSDQDSELYRGGFAVVCLASAALVFGIEAAPRSPVARLLALRPFAWIGAVSYGLYLWHWPLFIALNADRTGLEGTSLLMTRLAATVAVAAVSYYLVERPIRNGSLQRLPAYLGKAVPAIAMPAALVVLLIGTSGAVPPPLEESPFGPGAVKPGKKSLLVAGDSVGLSLLAAFPADRFPGWEVQGSTMLGCGLGEHQLAFDGVEGIVNKECAQVFPRWEAAIKAAKPDSVVLDLGAWEVYDHVIDGNIETVDSPAYADYLRGRLEQSHTVLTAGGAHLYVPDVPCYDQPSYELQGVDVAPIRNDPARAAAVNEVLTVFAAAHPSDTTLIPMAKWLCPDGGYVPTRDDVEIRYDGVHFTPEGGALFWTKVLMPELNSATHGD